jgi:hypothetical protein
MIWEAKDEKINAIQIEDKKIAKISNGWHVETVYFPGNKAGKDFNHLGVILARDTKDSCEGCIHRDEWPRYYCDECSRNWEDNYKKE